MLQLRFRSNFSVLKIQDHIVAKSRHLLSPNSYIDLHRGHLARCNGTSFLQNIFTQILSQHSTSTYNELNYGISFFHSDLSFSAIKKKQNRAYSSPAGLRSFLLYELSSENSLCSFFITFSHHRKLTTAKQSVGWLC